MAARFQPPISPCSEELSPEELAGDILSRGATGLTVSGGEPFEQAEELKTLLSLLAAKSYADVIVYSGYSGEKLARSHPWIKDYVACLIDGSFERDKPTDSAWRGSANQSALIFRHRELYEGWLRSRKGELQIASRGDNLYLIGIPKIGDAEKLLGSNNGLD